MSEPERGGTDLPDGSDTAPDADQVDGPIELDEQLPGSRRDLSLAQRVRAPDSYGLLFLGLTGVIIVSAGLSSFEFGRAVTFMLMASVLMFALWTSRAPRRAIVIAAVSLLLMVTIAVAGVVMGDRSSSDEIVAGLIVVLHLAVLLAIVRRIATHLVISWQTVFAALSTYLLIGMTFAALFAFLGEIYTEGVFAGHPVTTAVDYLYFSFITMTTVGYGDLTPGPDSIRMLAVTEALVGQIFLVTALALLVGNLGRERHPIRPRR